MKISQVRQAVFSSALHDGCFQEKICASTSDSTEVEIQSKTDTSNATLLHHGTKNSLSVFQYPPDYYLCSKTNRILEKPLLQLPQDTASDGTDIAQNYSEEHLGSFFTEHWHLQDNT